MVKKSQDSKDSKEREAPDKVCRNAFSEEQRALLVARLSSDERFLKPRKSSGKQQGSLNLPVVIDPSRRGTGANDSDSDSDSVDGNSQFNMAVDCGVEKDLSNHSLDSRLSS